MNRSNRVGIRTRVRSMIPTTYACKPRFTDLGRQVATIITHTESRTISVSNDCAYLRDNSGTTPEMPQDG